MIQLARAVREEVEISGSLVAEQLTSGFSAARRPQLAARLGTAFASEALSAAERAVALEIFKCLARDAEIEVRRTLAEHIKCSPLLPQSLAMRLAQDIEAVAVPILQSSLALSDDDLIAIIASGNTVKQCAIAERPVVSEAVSGALVETGKKIVVEALLANGGAAISESSYQTLLDAFGSDPEIQALLIDRATLPSTLMERIVCLVTEDLQARLIKQHAIPAALTEQLTLYGRERALVKSLSALSSLPDMEAAAGRIHAKGLLTTSLLLRALCSGQLEFFSAGLATLAGVPSAKAHKDLLESGPDTLKRLYRQAALPGHLQTAFLVALDVVFEVRRGGPEAWRAAEKDYIVRALVKAYGRLSPDGLESVLSQLGRLGPDDY